MPRKPFDIDKFLGRPSSETTEEQTARQTEHQLMMLESDKAIFKHVLRHEVNSSTTPEEKLAILNAYKERHLKWIEERLDNAILSLMS